MVYKTYIDTHQFRNVVKYFKETNDYRVGVGLSSLVPVVKFKGTVKLHGSNAGIQFDEDGNVRFGSRNRQLDLIQDNAGFMNAMQPLEQIGVFDIFKSYKEDNNIKQLNIYGEWFGKGVQSKVAVSELSKKVAIFSVIDENNKELLEDILTYIKLSQSLTDNDVQIYPSLDNLNKKDIYFINQFEMFDISVDMNNPEVAQNQMVETTNRVEKCCPVGKYFGVEGVGEGVVYTMVETIDGLDPSRMLFKVKGQEHSISKVKKLASVDIEKVNSVNEFVDNVVTENRLNQGLDYLKEMGLPLEMSSIGPYIQWVVKDVHKEESDGIVGNDLNPKMVSNRIMYIARTFFMSKFN